MSGFYLFVSSRDSVEFHKNNCYHDFRVELGREYDLSRRQIVRSHTEWSMALVEIDLINLVDNSSPRIKDDVLAVCDLISPSFIRGTERCVLRPIPLANSGHFASLYQPYYITLNTNSFSSVHITLLDRQLKPLDSNNGWPEESKFSLSCTLHFQRV